MCDENRRRAHNSQQRNQGIRFADLDCLEEKGGRRRGNHLQPDLRFVRGLILKDSSLYCSVDLRSPVYSFSCRG